MKANRFLRGCALACPLLLLLAAAAAATPFVNELIDGYGSVGQINDLAVDAQGRPHVVYQDADNWSVKYAVKTLGSWVVETIPSTVGVFGYALSLTLDSNGDPHLIYWRLASTDTIYYVHKSLGVWSTPERVIAGANVGPDLSLRLDANGYPHVVYVDGSAIKYTNRTTGMWLAPGSVEVIDADLGGVPGHNGLAIDSQGRPHVAYGDAIGLHGCVRYAVRNAGAWTVTAIDTTNGIGGTISLALDQKDHPHASYNLSGALTALRHAYDLGSGFVIENVDSTDTTETWIAIDAQDGVHISYLDETHGALKYAKKTGSTWSKEFVDAVGYVGCYSNIALDPEGVPHIVHYDQDNQDFKYATSAVRLVAPAGGELWSAGSRQEVVWQGPGVVDVLLSMDGGLTYDTWISSVSAHRVPVDVPALETDQARVKIVRSQSPYSSSSSPSSFTIAPDVYSPWWTELVDPNGSAGNKASLRLDSHDHPRIAALTGSTLKYYASAGSRWYVDSVASSSAYSSLALEKDGTPHISFTSNSAPKKVRFATRSTSTGWSMTTVDSSSAEYITTSLVIDATGRAHIAYFDNTNKDVYYATGTGPGWAGWSKTFIDGGTPVMSSNPAIAVDNDNLPHLLYYDSTNKRLRHAWQTSGGWSYETVSPGPIRCIAAAFGQDGVLHAAWMGNTDADTLYYARRAGGSWAKEIVETAGSFTSTGNISMVVDGEGRAHVSYMFLEDQLHHAFQRNTGWSIEIASQVVGEPEFSVAQEGITSSLAIDSRGVARIAYQRATIDHLFNANFDLRYASAAVELTGPAQADSWPAGTRRTVTWNGTGKVNVWLSTNGGLTYNLLSEGVRGGAYHLTVPSAASTECKVKVERLVPHSVAVSDSFFEIQSGVLLMALRAAPAEDGGGVLLSWATNPGPEDLEGYRVQRAAGGSWVTLLALTQQTSYRDPAGTAGSRYRLLAVNAMHDEILLGEASLAPAKPLAAWPVPLRSGRLTVSFATYGGLGGGADAARVTLHDVSGRLVRVLADGPFLAGTHAVTWDGNGRDGRVAPAGVYFIQSQSAGHRERMRVAIVR